MSFDAIYFNGLIGLHEYKPNLKMLKEMDFAYIDQLDDILGHR